MPGRRTKCYRVSSNEHFNLMSMLDKAYLNREKARESGTWEEEEAAEKAVEELEYLLDKAPYVGACVEWSVLSKIREVAAAREIMRDQACARCWADPR